VPTCRDRRGTGRDVPYRLGLAEEPSARDGVRVDAVPEGVIGPGQDRFGGADDGEESVVGGFGELLDETSGPTNRFDCVERDLVRLPQRLGGLQLDDRVRGRPAFDERPGAVHDVRWRAVEQYLEAGSGWGGLEQALEAGAQIVATIDHVDVDGQICQFELAHGESHLWPRDALAASSTEPQGYTVNRRRLVVRWLRRCITFSPLAPIWGTSRCGLPGDTLFTCASSLTAFGCAEEKTCQSSS